MCTVSLRLIDAASVIFEYSQFVERNIAFYTRVVSFMSNGVIYLRKGLFCGCWFLREKARSFWPSTSVLWIYIPMTFDTEKIGRVSCAYVIPHLVNFATPIRCFVCVCVCVCVWVCVLFVALNRVYLLFSCFYLLRARMGLEYI